MKHVYKEPEKDDANTLHSSVVAANYSSCNCFANDWCSLRVWGNADRYAN